MHLDPPSTDDHLTPQTGGVWSSVEASMEAVEQRLKQAVAQVEPFVNQVSNHLVAAGGKRARPRLTLLAAHLGDPTRPEIIDAAAVVELTHLATLYHDDVMDSAPTRRGAPAVHTLWGNNVAILAGDLLFARASKLVAGLGPEAVRIQAETFERLCVGQLHETVGPGTGEDPVQHYLQVLADKTGSLIATSGRFGAHFAGCDDNTVHTLTQFGEDVGLAFQLADDVLDLRSEGVQSGKTPGTDLREGVTTLPVLLVKQAAAQGDAASQELVEALTGDLSDDQQLAQVVAALREHPSLERTTSVAQSYATRAIEHLAALPASEPRDALESFARGVVDRLV